MSELASDLAQHPRRGRRPHGDRRLQIVRAAREVLAARGYAHTSLKQIAEHASIAPGLLTYYYPSKQDLMLDVVAELEEDFTRSWREAIDPAARPLERVRTAFDRAITTWSAQPTLFQIFFDLSTLASEDAAVKARIQNVFRRIRAAANEEMQNVVAELPAPLPADVDFAGAVTAGFHGALFEALTLGEDPTATLYALRAMVLSTVAMTYVIAHDGAPANPSPADSSTCEGNWPWGPPV